MFASKYLFSDKVKASECEFHDIIYSGVSVVANDPIYTSQAQWVFNVYELQ